MTEVQETKFSMFIAVRDFNTANEAALSALPSFATFNTQFTGIVEQIQSIRAEQKADRTGITLTKAEIKNELISQAADMCRNILAIAEVSGNSTLKAAVNYSQSDLRNAPDGELGDLCQIISNRAHEIQEELTEFNVTEEVVEALDTQLTAYLNALPKVKAAVTDRKFITGKLKSLFEQGDAVLKNKLDRLVETKRTTNVDLYTGYRNVRTLISEFGTRKLAVKVKVTDTTGEPVPNVKVIINGSNITKSTSVKGGFQIETMHEGIYTFNFSKNGYKPASAIVNVNDRETSKVNVVMEEVLVSVGVAG